MRPLMPRQMQRSADSVAGTHCVQMASVCGISNIPHQQFVAPWGGSYNSHLVSIIIKLDKLIASLTPCIQGQVFLQIQPNISTGFIYSCLELAILNKMSTNNPSQKSGVLEYPVKPRLGCQSSSPGLI